MQLSEPYCLAKQRIPPRQTGAVCAVRSTGTHQHLSARPCRWLRAAWRVAPRSGVVDGLQSTQPRRRLVALAAVLALSILIVVSGPHLVHHLAEQHPLVAPYLHTQHGDNHPTHTAQAQDGDAHHAEAHPQPTRDGPPQEKHAPPWPDCPVLFLLQHTPVAALALAVVSILCLVILLASPAGFRLSTHCTLCLHARAPPA